MRGMVSNTTDWSYRIPFALQWIFPTPILVAVIFAPESPWWLIRQNRFADAKASLRRLRTKLEAVSDAQFDDVLTGTMDDMIETNEREQMAQSGTSYKDCFKGVDRRRTEITCIVWIIQILCGSTFMGFSTYFCKITYLHPYFSTQTIVVIYSYLLPHRRTSRHRLLPRLHPLPRAIRPRPHRRDNLLGTNVALWSTKPLPLRPNPYTRLRPRNWHPSMCPAAATPQHPQYFDSTQLVHCRSTSRFHTCLRRHAWPYLLCAGV